MTSEQAQSRRYHIAVDIGGTFTDIYVHDDVSGTVSVAKVPSSADPIDAVMEGMGTLGVPLAEASQFRHGTTVATNALITRRLPLTAVVATRGFRDVVEIGRGNKEELWDLYIDTPPPYVRRRDRLEVTERVDFEGSVTVPLDEEDARRVAGILRRRGVKAVAVCFMNAYANPANELRMQEILEEELEGVVVCASADVLPQIFEHQRFSTTVANAALGPLLTDYVYRLEGSLRETGYQGDLLILHSGGGVMTPAAVERLPVRLAGSGIAAGAIAARHIAVTCGYENALGLDMGGTSTDISLIHEGQLETTDEWEVSFGQPICFPSVEVLTIGAGGGSIAWLDGAGALHNGPQSAGAEPGPAAYGRGGEVPTTTDANLALGRLGEKLVGGAMTLDVERSRRAIEHDVAEPLGLDLPEAAKAIVRVANANMADALRLISVSRGYDPRDFALVVFGGGGPLHAVALARELSIPMVIIPPNPGITSAAGCLLVDIRHDLTTMFLARLDGSDTAAIDAALAELDRDGRALLASEGVDPADMTLQRSVDLRYVGQWRSLKIPLPDGPVDSAALIESFHQAHAREHNYRREDTPIELYRLNVEAVGRTPRPDGGHAEAEEYVPEPQSTREVIFDELEEPQVSGVYDRAELRAGAKIAGPAIVEQLDSTTLVPPGVNAEIDNWLNIRMEITNAAGE